MDPSTLDDSITEYMVALLGTIGAILLLVACLHILIVIFSTRRKR